MNLTKICLVVTLAMLVIFSMLILPACKVAAPNEVQVEFYASASGTTSNMLSTALADIVNKNSSWLRVSVLEAATDLEKLTVTDSLPPERRETAISTPSAMSFAKATQGIEPFPRKFSDLKIVNVEQFVWNGWVSYNPDITSPQDFAGKKLGVWPKGHGMIAHSDALIKVWGLTGKVEQSNLRPTGFKDALMTGIIDAAFVTGTKWGETYVASPYNIELMGAKKPYFINISAADIEAVNEIEVGKIAHGVIPKDAFGPDKPPQDTGVLYWAGLVCCYDSADDDVIYELVKVTDENAKMFGDYMPLLAEGQKGGKYLADYPMLTKDTVHPAAWKYFKEKGYVQ